MNSDQLFGMALGLEFPWEVIGVDFKSGESAHRELHLQIGFSKGYKFKDETGMACGVYDTARRTWQHLNFFEHHCFLHCKVPRIKTSEGHVRTVNVPWAREGSGFTLIKESLAAIAAHLAQKGVPATQIKEISMDLSPAFIAGAKASFPAAQITFDRFHVVKLLNEAMDTVRRDERKEHIALKNHKYTFLKNKENLSPKKQADLEEMIERTPNIGKAYRLKVWFNDLWGITDHAQATCFLQTGCQGVEDANIPAFQKFAKTVKAHWTGILRYIQSHITNAILESINSKIQLAKRRARGYRNINNYINMIYFLCGKMNFTYPRYST